MINLAIAGFGNVGKSLYRLAKNNPHVHLSHVFTSRKFNLDVKTFSYDQIEIAPRVDCTLLALSSYNQLPHLAKEFLACGNTIDCFDNTDEFDSFVLSLDKKAKQSETVALCGAGWDPGLFDVARKLFAPLGKIGTSWGRGMSCGHSNAVRSIEGVVDAVEWTVPTSIGHTRQVFVTSLGDNKEIEAKIKAIPHYFLGLDTNVVFVGSEELKKIKADFSHQGKIWFENENHKGQLTLTMKDNPAFTATIMFNAIPLVVNFCKNKKFGAYTLCDCPLNNFGNFEFDTDK